MKKILPKKWKSAPMTGLADSERCRPSSVCTTPGWTAYVVTPVPGGYGVVEMWL